MQEVRVQSLGWEDPLEQGIAIHSSLLAWRIPWTEDLFRLQYIRLQRVGHNWSERAHTHKYKLAFKSYNCINFYCRLEGYPCWVYFLTFFLQFSFATKDGISTKKKKLQIIINFASWILKGLLLKLKCQYFGHLMQRDDSLGKTLMLTKKDWRQKEKGEAEDEIDSVTDSMDMNLSKCQEIMEDRRAGMLQSVGSQRVAHDWTTAATYYQVKQCASISVFHPRYIPSKKNCPGLCIWKPPNGELLQTLKWKGVCSFSNIIRAIAVLLLFSL